MLNAIRSRRWVLARRMSQIVWAGFFVWVLWSTTYPLTGPVSPNLLFAADPLLVGTLALSERTFVPHGWIALLIAGLTLVLGRFFCGWMCPLGFGIDLGSRLRPARRPEAELHSNLRFLKFGVLGLVVLAAAGGLQVAWALDPIVIAGRFVSLNLVPVLVNATDKVAGFVIPTFHLYGWPLDAYRTLKSGLLNVNARLAGHAFVILAMTVAIVGAGMWTRRFWCRALCPLGALYALLGRAPLLRRTVGECIGCEVCKTSCRTHAIDDAGTGYAPGECVLCMDCVHDCPVDVTSFSFRRPAVAVAVATEPAGAISRGDFLTLTAGTLTAAAVPSFTPHSPIRPPGAIPEDQFVDRCIRCGNCMKVCLTNGLHPSVMEAGLRGLWTPRMVAAVGYCEYSCTMCGQVCPVGAITPLPLPEKKKFVMGTAAFDPEICLPWKEGQECLCCEEHCPVGEKAIKMEWGVVKGKRVKRPKLDETLCIGCGICEHKCPVRPARGVTVRSPAEFKSYAATRSPSLTRDVVHRAKG